MLLARDSGARILRGADTGCQRSRGAVSHIMPRIRGLRTPRMATDFRSIPSWRLPANRVENRDHRRKLSGVARNARIGYSRGEVFDDGPVAGVGVYAICGGFSGSPRGHGTDQRFRRPKNLGGDGAAIDLAPYSMIPRHADMPGLGVDFQEEKYECAAVATRSNEGWSQVER